MFLDRAMSKRGSFFSKQNYNNLFQTKCQGDFFLRCWGETELDKIIQKFF